MITNQQKALIHIYKAAADLDDPTYRNILRHRAGVDSSADRSMDQSGFENVMASLETILFERVSSGQAKRPRSRYIRAEYYWRRRLPRTGYINSRQHHLIMQLWHRLGEWLPAGSATDEYLAGIILKATGLAIPGAGQLTARQAAHVIDALQDRLSHALRTAPRATEEALYPF